MEMDCSRTESGVFELKVIVKGSSEGIIKNKRCVDTNPNSFDSDRLA